MAITHPKMHRALVWTAVLVIGCQAAPESEGQGALSVELPGSGCTEHDGPGPLASVVRSDGSAIECELLSEGPDVLPPGVSFDPVECMTVGEPGPSRVGTWAVLVRLEQAGTTQYVPHCVAGEGGLSNLAVDVAPSSLGRGSFEDGRELSFASGDDLLFSVESPASCGEDCDVVVVTSGSFAPFEGVVPAEIREEKGTGFVRVLHGLRAEGAPVESESGGEPFVVGVDVDYCFAGAQSGNCAGPQQLFENKQPGVHVSILMSPQEP